MSALSLTILSTNMKKHEDSKLGGIKNKVYDTYIK